MKEASKVHLENKRVQNSYFVFLSVLVGLRDLNIISYNKFLLVGLFFVYVCIANAADLIYILCFTFPFACGLPMTYMLPIALIGYMLKSNKLNISTLCLGGVFIAHELLLSIGYTGVAFSDLVYYCSAIILLFLMLCDNDIKINYSRTAEIFLYAIVVVVSVIFVATILDVGGNFIHLVTQGSFRFGNDSNQSLNSDMHLILNANNIAYFCVTGNAISLVLFYIVKNVRKKVYSIICFVVLTFIGLMTQSRSYILIFFIILVMFCVSSIKSRKGRCFLSLIIGCCAVGVFLLIKYRPEIISNVIGRFANETVGTAGGRTVIFHEYFIKWIEDPLRFFMGAGVINYAEVYGIDASIHCGGFQIFLCYGIVVGLIFLGVLVYPILFLFRRHVKLIFILPYFAVILFTQTIQFLNPYFLMFPYIIAVYVVKIDVRNRTLNAVRYRIEEIQQSCVLSKVL